MRGLVQVLTIVLLLAAASGIYWITTLRRPELPVAPEGPTPHQPDYYFTDFTAMKFEKPGAPSYILHGRRLTHYADDDTAEVRAPRLAYLPAGDAPWRLTARHGRIKPPDDRIVLSGDVVARQRPAGQPPITLRTSRVTLLTERGIARTHRPVEATGNGWRMTGRGMTAYLERELVKLHHDVTGRYGI